MRTLHGRAKPQSARAGQALTEFALAIPILFFLLFGLIEIGFMIKTRMVLQDAARTAWRYGVMAGTIAGSTGCLSDLAVLDAVRNRLQASLVDPRFVRAVFIYNANDGDDNPTTAPASVTLNGNTYASPSPGNLDGDYYYADYNASTGQNVDTSGTTNTGTGQGAIYKLFNNQESSIFSNGAAPGAPNVPTCGSSLLQSTHSTLYFDTVSGGTAGPTNSAVLGSPQKQGNWPPVVRNNETDLSASGGARPDRFGVAIIYDYQFHTPVFQVISNLFLAGRHMFRMVEQTSDYISPQ